ARKARGGRILLVFNRRATPRAGMQRRPNAGEFLGRDTKMPGGAAATCAGGTLEDRVAALAEALQLSVRRQVRVGRRIWGAERRIDLVIGDAHRRRLGIECKFQGTGGTAEEKIPATIEDIRAWPIPGLVVFDGQGFSNHMRAFLVSTGKAVELDDLEAWLRLYFGLDL
ncbi:MAG: PD-(D/E)XK nuclease superfamily protein, partial [Myxococcota bacterium]